MAIGGTLLSLFITTPISTTLEKTYYACTMPVQCLFITTHVLHFKKMTDLNDNVFVLLKAIVAAVLVVIFLKLFSW